MLDKRKVVEEFTLPLAASNAGLFSVCESCDNKYLCATTGKCCLLPTKVEYNASSSLFDVSVIEYKMCRALLYEIKIDVFSNSTLVRNRFGLFHASFKSWVRTVGHEYFMEFSFTRIQ